MIWLFPVCQWDLPIQFNQPLLSRTGVVCAILSCEATITSDHDAIMCVWCEVNGKEVNSKCGKIASSLIVRHTILGGIGVIQHVLKQQNYLGASEFRRLFFASITRLRSERNGLCVGRDCRNQRPKFACSRGDIEDLEGTREVPVDRSSDKGDPSGPTEDSGGDRGGSRGPYYSAEAAVGQVRHQGHQQGPHSSYRDQPDRKSVV